MEASIRACTTQPLPEGAPQQTHQDSTTPFVLPTLCQEEIFGHLSEKDKIKVRWVSPEAYNALLATGHNPPPEPLKTFPRPASHPNDPSLVPIETEKSQAVSPSVTQAVVNSASFTKGSFELLGPQYSSFLGGLSLLFRKSHDVWDIFAGFFGFLLLMASPVWEPLRLSAGALGTVGGAIATVGSGIAYGASWIGNKVTEPFKNAEQKKQQVEAQRDQLARSFAKRMVDILDAFTLTPEERAKMRHNPEALVGFAALMVAFQSRNDHEGILRMRDGKLLRRRDISGQKEIRKEYFEAVHRMKTAMQELNLSQDDNTAWNQVKAGVDQMHRVFVEEQPKQELSPTVRELMDEALLFSSKVVADPVFQAAWEQVQA